MLDKFIYFVHYRGLGLARGAVHINNFDNNQFSLNIHKGKGGGLLKSKVVLKASCKSKIVEIFRGQPGRENIRRENIACMEKTCLFFTPSIYRGKQNDENS